MKKIVTLLYLVLLVMTLIACGKENSKTPAEQGNEHKETNHTGTVSEKNQNDHQDQAGEKGRVEGTRIKITIGDQKLIAVMEDNPTTRSFLSKLPVTLNFRDFEGGE